MAFPENQIAALDLIAATTAWPRAFSIMSVSRGRRDARGLQRGLDQAGTIQPLKGLAAPDIGHAQKLFRHGDKIGRRARRAAPDARHGQSRRDLDEIALLAHRA